MTEERAWRVLRKEVERELANNVPTYFVVGLLPKLLTMMESQTAELAKLQRRLDRIKHASNGTSQKGRRR